MTYETPRSDKVAAREPKLPGEDAAVGELGRTFEMTDPAEDMDTNELTAAGQTCVLCHQVIEPGAAARRHLDGAYQHEFCPEPLP
jgi:hypothetical protein